MPVNPSWCKGIDIGDDGVIDPAKVRGAGHEFVISRVTRTNGLVDKDFHENLRRCLGDGLTFGTYFWPGPGHAEKFLNECPPNPALIPPAIDLETNPRGLSPKDYWEEAHAELVQIEKAWNPTGGNTRRTLIYGGRDWLTRMLPHTDPNIWAHPLWFAHPGSSPGPLPPQWADHGQSWILWQCGFGEGPNPATLPGGKKVDWNRFAGTHDDLVKRFGLKA